MAKFQSPLLGYNNNVRHKNRVFHIQTEDSGVNHPHIITHLFMDGGRILKSVKKSYAEHVGADGMNDIVRGMMKEQHKAIFIALRDGQFDDLVDPAAAAKAAAAAATAAAATAAAATAAADAGSDGAAETADEATEDAAKGFTRGFEAKASEGADEKAKSPAAPPVAAATVSSDVAAAHAETAPDVGALSAASASAAGGGPPTNPEPPHVETDVAPNTIDDARRPNISLPPPPLADEVPMTTRQAEPPLVPSPAPPQAAAASAKATSPSGRELTLDFEALEQAAQDAVAAPSLFHATELPPPPKNLFAREPGTGGAYRAVEADPRHEPRPDPRLDPQPLPREERARSDPREEPGPRTGRREVPAPPPSTRGERAAATARGSVRAPTGSRPPGEARYAPARPAAIFGSTQRPPPQSSLFSDELVSDKSLDEVILSYLAEDLEPPRQK